MSAKRSDPRVTKRRVTMQSLVAVPPQEEGGQPGVGVHKAVDYVRPDFLDAYVADARTKWQVVEVSDAPDAGPGGYDGPTFVPDHLNHPAAGQFYPATGDHPLAGMTREAILAAAEKD